MSVTCVDRVGGKGITRETGGGGGGEGAGKEREKGDDRE